MLFKTVSQGIVGNSFVSRGWQMTAARKPRRVISDAISLTLQRNSVSSQEGLSLWVERDGRCLGIINTLFLANRQRARRHQALESKPASQKWTGNMIIYKRVWSCTTDIIKTTEHATSNLNMQWDGNVFNKRNYYNYDVQTLSGHEYSWVRLAFCLPGSHNHLPFPGNYKS